MNSSARDDGILYVSTEVYSYILSISISPKSLPYTLHPQKPSEKLHSAQFFICGYSFKRAPLLAIVITYTVRFLQIVVNKRHWKIKVYLVIITVTLKFRKVHASPCTENVIIPAPFHKLFNSLWKWHSFFNKFTHGCANKVLHNRMKRLIYTGGYIFAKVSMTLLCESSLTAPISIISMAYP